MHVSQIQPYKAPNSFKYRAFKMNVMLVQTPIRLSVLYNLMSQYIYWLTSSLLHDDVVEPSGEPWCQRLSWNRGRGAPGPWPLALSRLVHTAGKNIVSAILVEARFRYPDVDCLLYSSFKLPVFNCQDLDLVQTHSMFWPIHVHMLWHLSTNTTFPPVFQELSFKWYLNLIYIRSITVLA